MGGGDTAGQGGGVRRGPARSRRSAVVVCPRAGAGARRGRRRASSLPRTPLPRPRGRAAASEVKRILEDDEASEPGPSSDDFWVMAAALRGFVVRRGALLRGTGAPGGVRPAEALQPVSIRRGSPREQLGKGYREGILWARAPRLAGCQLEPRPQPPAFSPNAPPLPSLPHPAWVARCRAAPGRRGRRLPAAGGEHPGHVHHNRVRGGCLCLYVCWCILLL
jgi:hypothetical protein